ncbi:SWIM-type domain-containing protein [Citrus sinensis]|uniref:SWIM-type domain-containing protein n=1 Tax=Citrus sinensis TaxID=2711 RepID=A0ACB8KEB6_CITSI|nr:SWIM-type domain-containing protein [Citrus sinensis]
MVLAYVTVDYAFASICVVHYDVEAVVDGKVTEITPENQFSVNLNVDPEINWNELDDVEEINNENNMTQFSIRSGYLLEDDMTVHFSSENSGKNGKGSTDTIYTSKSDGEESDEENARSDGEESDYVLDDYQSGDETGDEFDSSDEEIAACVRYDTNSGGFEFTQDGDNLVLRPGQLFVDVYEFRKVLRIAATYLHIFKSTPEVSVKLIAAELLKKYGIECSVHRLYRAKQKALELLGQDHKKSYSKLSRYQQALIKYNPGSTVAIERELNGDTAHPVFKRFFMMLDASRRGFFEGCRQFVGVDGCHLKGPYKGVLLTAVGIDANYGIYPLALCVVESENTYSWEFFMEKLYDQIGCNGGEGLCFMSDRQKGVINAIDRVFPNAIKRYCCRHIYANFKQKFPGTLLKKVFWKACRSPNYSEFSESIEELKKISDAAHRWLMNIPTVYWAKHTFPNHTKCNHVTNNMTESFNNWINSFRGMPIVRMLEEIRRKIMKLIHKRNEDAKKWNGHLPPLVRRKIVEARAAARGLTVIFGHENTFEVMEDLCKVFVVDLAFINTYKYQYFPLPDEKMWPLVLHDNLQPPIIIKSVGRPQIKRRKEADEPATFKRSSSVKCSKCEHWGHNKRTCKRTKVVNGEGTSNSNQPITQRVACSALSQPTVHDNDDTTSCHGQKNGAGVSSFTQTDYSCLNVTMYDTA